MAQAIEQALRESAPLADLAAALPQDARALLRRQARLLALPTDTVLFRPGDACRQYLVVVRGAVRVGLTAVNGREMLLYRVGAGQTCVLTTMALMGNRLYEAEGRAETAVDALALPAAAFEQLLAEPVFRRFVFDSLSMRVLDLMHLLGQVAFARLDARLAAFLLHHAGQGALRMTHQDIAVELAASREAVSRLLKGFERHGWLRLGRGELRVLNPAALRRVAMESGDLTNV